MENAPNNMKRSNGKLTDRVTTRETNMIVNSLKWEIEHNGYSIPYLAEQCHMTAGSLYPIMNGKDCPITVKHYNKIFDWLSGEKPRMAKREEIPTPQPTPTQTDPNVEMVVKSLKYLEQKYGKDALELGYMDYSIGGGNAEKCWQSVESVESVGGRR